MDIELVTHQLPMLYIIGFAIQQALELVGVFIEGKDSVRYGKIVFRACAIALAVIACVVENGLILKISGNNLLNFCTSVLVIASGTEGINSIIKFLAYTKELIKKEGG